MATNNAINSTSGGNFQGKNMVINGDMQVWQRGAGGAASFAVPASTTQYTADRWQILTGANEASVIAQTAGATSGSWLARIQKNNAQTGTAVMRFCTSLTRDMCIGAAGNFITLSFKARSGALFSAAASALTVTVYSGTGTTDISGIAGAFTGNASAIASTATLTTSLQNFSFTSAAALGSTVTQLAVEVSYAPVGTAGATDYFDITDVQLEIGSLQTPFDRRNFGMQLQNCQRFYEKSFAYATAPAQNVGASSSTSVFPATSAAASQNISSTIYYKVQKLAAVNPTLYSPGAATAQIYNATRTAGMTATALYAPGSMGFMTYATGSAGTLPGDICEIHWTADADVI